MNKSPINYLATTALAALLWVILAVFIGGSFSESLILAESTPEEFLSAFRMISGSAALTGLISCLYWYYYGNLDSTAGKLGQAKKTWWLAFIFQIIISVVLLVIIIFINLTEGIPTSQWLLTYLFISAHTWFFFWITTFFMSPRSVKYIPLFK